MVIAEAFVASLTGALIYYTILKPRKQETTFANLLVYGGILPFWIVSPYFFIQMADLRNLIFKFVVAVITPTLTLFRTTEGRDTFIPGSVGMVILSYSILAYVPPVFPFVWLRCTALYGFAPTHSTKSAAHYILYFSTPVLFQHDKDGNFIKATWRNTVHHIIKFKTLLFVLGLYQSWLISYPDMSVSGAPADKEDWFALYRIFSPKQWQSNFFQAGTCY